MISNKIVWMRILDLAPVILLLSLIVIFTLVDDRIISGQNMLQVLVQAMPIAVLAIGAMVVLISGGIDLSAGFGVGLCSVIFASVLTGGGSLVMALIYALLVGVLIGVFNGFFVGFFKIQPFIVTLGSMTIVQGVTLAVATSGVLVVSHPFLSNIGIGRTLSIPNIVLVTLGLIFVGFILLKYTSFGLRTFGVGSSIESSTSSGVPIIRQQIMIYVFSGVCTAITAMILVSRVSIISPNIGGIPLLLDAITATVIGGTSIYGGKGSISGTLIGALIISLITYALTVFGVSASSLDFFKGAIIIIALSVDSLIRQTRSRLDTRNAV